MIESVHAQIISALVARAEHLPAGLRMPPPAFLTMQGEFLEFDEQAQTLTVKFPVLVEYLNPFGTMQGGFVAAAVDNAIGPLSMLLAPPSVTHRLEMKYSRAIAEDIEYIRVQSQLVELRKRRLILTASVLDAHDQILATAKATNWIVVGPGT